MAPSAPASSTSAKAPKKKTSAKPKNASLSVGELIVKAVSASKERTGVSLVALKKALSADGYDVEKNNSRVKLAVKGLVIKGTLVQTKGIGASGSFKLNRKQTEVKKAAAPKVKNAVKKPTAAKKPKKVAAKKPASTKKSPKKAKKTGAAAKKATESTKKTKKPATSKKAAKSPKKATKSPKKAAKSPKKAKAAKPKAAKPKTTKARKAAPKKK